MILELLVLCSGLILATGVGYVLFRIWLYYQKQAVREVLEHSNWTEEQIEEALQTYNLDVIRKMIYDEQQDQTAGTGQDLSTDENDIDSY